MTPTERVRVKLDTHGVEWEAIDRMITAVTTREGNEIMLYESVDGKFVARYLTPEQAGKIGVFLA